MLFSLCVSVPSSRFSISFLIHLGNTTVIFRLASLINNSCLKPLLHDQIFCDKFHVSNVFWPCKLEIFDKFVEKS